MNCGGAEVNTEAESSTNSSYISNNIHADCCLEKAIVVRL
jgi:hypothetical protein